MTKIYKVATLAAAVLVAGMTQSASAETLRVGMECTYTPFNFRTAAGELDGYDVDVAKGVAKLVGADVEYVCQKWSGMIPALLANKFDLVVASMSITDKRKQKMNFSVPYRISVGRLVGAKKAGLERSSTYASWFEANLPDAKVVFYDSSETMYLDLENGRTDMIMTNPMKAHLKFLSKENGKGYEFVSPAIEEEKYFGIGVGIGLRKGNDALLTRLNKAVTTLSKDGSLEKYALKYFPFAIHKPL